MLELKSDTYFQNKYSTNTQTYYANANNNVFLRKIWSNLKMSTNLNQFHKINYTIE